MPDITVSSDIHSFMQSATDADARDNLGIGDSDAVNHASLTLTGNAEAVEFIGDLEGAVRFNAKAGEALTKGDAVYVSGISGNLPVVSKADSSSSATMPSFGLAGSTVSLNASVQIVTFGTLSSIDTSSYTAGDNLYVNGTGTLQTTKPTGESNLVQNIGMVQRVHATAGSIKVGGAGRTNDTPNLDENKIFIGNSSNAASTAAIGTVITDNASSVKTSYESNSDTNAFTDAEQTKLSGIATGAEVNAVDSVNTQTGSVTLDADDIDDTSTTHKFATAAQLAKIDGVESGATQDQSGSEIKTAYEGESDTNAFTDAEKTKLSGIETGATADQDLSSYQLQPSEGAFANGDKTKLDGIEASADVTDATNVTAAGALMDSEVTNLAQVKAFDSSDYATAAQGTKADSAQQPPAEGAFVDGDKTKLDGIAAGAEVNAVDSVNTQTGAVVLDADDISDAATTNKFTTAADISKLAGIEAGADVTDTANVTAAGALMDSEVDADIKTLSLPASTTISTFGASLVDDADAATARTTLGVDAAGTDNSTDVTLTGSGTYLSIAGQAITVDPITESDISDLGTYLTAESDTLDTVTGRGATTTNGITVGSIDVNGEIVELAVNTTSVTGSTALDPANGTIQRLTFSGAVTFTDSLADGESITLHIDDGTAYAATWPTMEWVGGSAPTLDTTNETIAVVWKVNSTLYGMSSGVAS